MSGRLNIAEATSAGILAIATVGLALAWAGYAFSDLEQALVAAFAMLCDLIWQLRRKHLPANPTPQEEQDGD